MSDNEVLSDRSERTKKKKKKKKPTEDMYVLSYVFIDEVKTQSIILCN